MAITMNIESEKFIELSGSLLILIAVPTILILSMSLGISQYATIPGLDVILPNWIHYGNVFLYGNIMGFVLTFPILMIVASNTKSLIPTTIAILIFWPLFSFISQSLIGGYNPAAWGFSGYLYAFYGAIVYFTTIGAYTWAKNNYLRAASLLIPIVAGIPVFLSPPIVDSGWYVYHIATWIHAIGMIFGMVVPAVWQYLQYSNWKSCRLWMIGGIAIVLEWHQFIPLIQYIGG